MVRGAEVKMGLKEGDLGKDGLLSFFSKNCF